MLSLSSQSQNLSDEDNSGSDSRSEVELKPETDRFGFIVTNRTTAGCVGPPPELVRQREAKWINIIVQWDRILSKNNSKVKVQCQKGIPASLRAKCWPLLCGATDKMEQNKNLYQSLDLQPALQSWVDVIERDLDRQFPFHEMFLSKDGHGQRGLFRVLKAYTQHQPEEGYCQAQGPVAAVLLMNMPAEEAFWCLVQISEQYLPGYYSPLLEGVLFDAAMLTWVLKRACPAVHRHLQYYGVEPLMFATDWLMCLFTRHLPFNTLLRVWDLFFCYGVRVLLQVAVVLVRRVLGRAEQRKKCQGQMETLERLRGVREHVQEEDDTFIAEVCSVPLSARELQKQTEKEIEKWRKDRPSSTFDPRRRCLGYQMVWAMARQKQEDQEMMEREEGNLSVPLNRSASTLSLSLSNHHKKKGGKVKADEWEGGSRVVRHLSMGAKEDYRSWTGGNFKKVLRGVQGEEHIVSEEHEKQSEPKLTEHTEHREPKTFNIQNIPIEQLEKTVTVKEQIEQVETRTPEMEESQFKDTERSKMISEQTEETNVETVPTKNLTLEKTLQASGHTTEHKVGEELELGSHSQFLEQQNYKSKSQETEVKDKNKKTEKQIVESDHSAAAEETPTQIQKYADADTNTELETDGNVQKTHVDIVTALSVITISETSSDSDTDREVEAQPVKSLTIETEAQQQQQEVITETDNCSQEEEFKKHHSTEAETDMEKESHIQKVSESDVLVQTTEQLEETRATQEELESERAQRHSEQPTDPKTETETLILYLHECNQTKEGTDLVTESETEAEIPLSNDKVSETSEALARNSEVECDAVEHDPTQGKDGFLTARSEVDKAQTQAEERPTQTEMIEVTSDSTSPPQKELTSQDEEVNLTTKPDGKTSSEETNTYEEPAPALPKIVASMYAVEEEESLEIVKENTVGDSSIIISIESTNPNTGSNQQVQDKDSHIVKDQAELRNSSLTQASGRRSSRSSGDFCIRKSSGSRGPRLGRRLSEDLFTVPQKTSQSQPIPNQPEIKHTELRLNPGAVNPTQRHPDLSPANTLSPSKEATDRTETQQEPPNPPKRFGFFGRLKGEPAKKTKAKGTPKMQVPKILIQDFSDVTEMEKPVKEEREEKLSSRERRRRQREQDRRVKEEERLRKKREKELEKVTERERRKPQTRGKSFQVEREKGGSSDPQPAKTGSQIIRYSASYTYF